MPRFISRRKLAEDAYSVLSDLGTSAEEVASSLVEYGVRAGAETSSSNLLTFYLNAVMGGGRRVRLVEVTDDEAQTRTGPIGGGTYLIVHIPTRCRQRGLGRDKPLLVLSKPC
jgi:hypothetical protein